MSSQVETCDIKPSVVSAAAILLQKVKCVILLETYIKIMIPVFGFFIGSFANVLIYRIPRGEEWVYTPSHCVSCGRKLRFYDMVPVFSWLFLRGRCRFCKSPISPRYPAVELINAILWLICSQVFGLSVFLFVSLAVSTALLILAFIDWDISEIPDGTNLFLLIIGVLWNAYAFFAGYGIWLQNIVGFFCVSVLLLLIAMASKGGMGGGDIKLTAVCGFILGWQNILLSLGIAAIFGTAIMLPIHLIKKKERGTPVPFGPFLAMGIFIAMCFGKQIIGWYLG